MGITKPDIILQHLDKNINTKKLESEDKKGLMEVSKQFEAIFLDIMLKQMRRTVIQGGFTEKSYARQIYESMKDEELTKEMAKGRGVGLAQEIYRQLSRYDNIKQANDRD